MATVTEVATASFNWILQQDSVEPVTAKQITDYIFLMNNFMNGLAAENIDLGYTTVASGTDEVTVLDGALRGLVANMAVEIAPSYDGDVTARLNDIAVTGLNQMRILGQTLTDTQYPSTLPIGSGNENDTGDLLFSHFYREIEEEEEVIE